MNKSIELYNTQVLQFYFCCPYFSKEDPELAIDMQFIVLNFFFFFFFAYFSSVAQSCPSLCDPMNCSTPASLFITKSRGSPKPMYVELVMPSNHFILCNPLLLLPSILPSIRIFSNESVLHIRWPKYWRFSFSISPSNEHPGMLSFRMMDVGSH